MRTPYPQPISELAGTRRVIETATKLVGAMWGDEGTSRVQHAYTADPGIARRLATGQAGYINRGGCTWIQIARPRPRCPCLPRRRRPARDPGRPGGPNRPPTRRWPARSSKEAA